MSPKNNQHTKEFKLDATGYLPKGHYYAIVTNIVVTDEFITYLFYLYGS